MMNNYPVLTRIAVLLFETFLTLVSYTLAIYIRNFFGYSDNVLLHQYLNVLLLILIFWWGLSEYQEAYSGKAFSHSRYQGRIRTLREDLLNALRTVLIGCPAVYVVSLVLSLFSRYYATEWLVPKSFIFFFGIINLVLLSFGKIFLHSTLFNRRRGDKEAIKVLVLGSGAVAEQFIRNVKRSHRYGVNIVGLIAQDASDVGKEVYGSKIINHITNLKEILHSDYTDEVVVALSINELGQTPEIIELCDQEGVPVRVISPFFKDLISKARPEIFFGSPIVRLIPVERNDLEMAIKRLIDIIVSLFGLILLSPLILTIILINKVLYRGSIFYRWNLLGLNKKPFVSYKFRTMVENAEEIEKELRQKNENEMKGVYFKLEKDFRVTPFGRFLRKYSLDEIPQLFSVLQGKMTLVGPRPVRIMEREELKNWHRRRFCVKPGVTSPWVVLGKNAIPDFDEIARLDLDYIDNWTLWKDIKIMLKTVPVIIFGKNF